MSALHNLQFQVYILFKCYHYYFGRIPKFSLILVGVYIMSKFFTKILISCFFVSDFSDRLCETFNSEEGDQWKIPREIPSHSTDLDQAQKVREMKIMKNCVKKKMFTLYMYLSYNKWKNHCILLDFFSIKRELKVITHTKVKLWKIFLWLILTWIYIKPIQIFFRNPGDLERKLLFLFVTVSIKFLCYLFQCGLDLWIVAQAYVYFEKLILKVCYNYHHLILQNNLQDITHFSFCTFYV